MNDLLNRLLTRFPKKSAQMSDIAGRRRGLPHSIKPMEHSEIRTLVEIVMKHNAPSIKIGSSPDNYSVVSQHV